MSVPVLGRSDTGVEALPVRMVHLGIGAFARSLPLWLTEQVNRAGRDEPWGAAVYTGTSPRQAELLQRQDGLYHVLRRSAADDVVDRVDCISAATDGSQLSAVTASLADAAVTVVTTTFTEAGHRMSREGALDRDDPGVHSDLAVINDFTHRGAADFAEGLGSANVVTAVGRLLIGLEARRRSGHGVPLTIVPCDNLPANGRTLKHLLFDAAAGSPELTHWLDREVTVADSVVDRITPAAGPQEREAIARMTGVEDRAAVVTEPYFAFTLAGATSAARPEWESVGAQSVSDVAPYERRKLRLLNGAHSLLAHGGRLRGHRYVHEAIADPVLLDRVHRWWAEAAVGLPDSLEVEQYSAELARRFSNHRLPHRLDQIAIDSEVKLGIRIVPVVRATVARGESAAAGLYAVAAWLVDTSPEHAEMALDARVEALAPGLLDHDAVRSTLTELVAEVKAGRGDG